MSSRNNSNNGGSSFFNWLAGLGVGTVVGAGLFGAAWYFAFGRIREPRTRPPRAPRSHNQVSRIIPRSLLPKRHFSYLITKEKKIGEDFRAYLTEVFKIADEDEDGALTPQDFNSLALLLRGELIQEDQIDWYFETFETDENGNLTLEGFLDSYEWPLNSGMDEESIAKSYQEEIVLFGCTADHWIEK